MSKAFIYLLSAAILLATLIVGCSSDPPTPRPTPVTFPSPTTPSEYDRAALIALYNATDGPNWHYNKGWLSNAPMGQWSGVTTDGDGRVIKLDLSNNQLRGEIPPGLGSLIKLKYLDFGAQLGHHGDEPINYLSGKIPAELGNLVDLAHLDLGGTGLVGTGVGGRIPPELGNLYNLELLNLRNNRLNGKIPPELGNLSNLRELRLGGNKFNGGIPLELGNLTNLEVLFIVVAGVNGEIPPELGSLGNLKGLYLYGNKLSGEIPPELGNLSNLENLYLGWNTLSEEIPPELGRLTKLHILNLENNGLGGGIPPELGGISGLGTLNLSDNLLSGEIQPELGTLSNLQTLELSGNRFTGCIPAGLADIPNDLGDSGLQLCPSLPAPPPVTGIDGAPLPEEWTGDERIAKTASSADMVAVGEEGLNGALHLVQIHWWTRVTVTLHDAGPGPFAAAIRRGSCPSEGGEPSGQFEYLLFDIVDGKSISMVDTPAQFFQFSPSYVVVVSGTDQVSDPPVSCGNIPALSASL